MGGGTTHGGTTGRGTVVRVELAGRTARAARLDSGEFLRPRLVGTDGAHIQVALVGIRAALLAGDEITIDVDVGPGVRLELIEPTGMVAYDAKGEPAHWAASVRVATAGSLIWRAAPFVAAGGADVTRRTRIELGRDAVALVSETMVLGRAGESGGLLRAEQHVTLDRRELLVEELDLRCPELRSAPGIVGGAHVVATTALLGSGGPEPCTAYETRLAGPGLLARATTKQAHEADAALAETWRRWREHLTAAPGSTAPDPAAACWPATD